MLSALYRYAPGERRRVAQEWARRSNARQSNARVPDAETLMRRALDDARGQKIDEGYDWIGGKERHWLIRRSLHGRTNQVDIVINGTLWRTGALAHARHAIKWGKWPAFASHKSPASA